MTGASERDRSAKEPMSAQHTPGPWRIGVSSAVEGRAFDGSWKFVAFPVRGGTPDQADTNARLIAAAPEMYEAAQPLVAEISEYEPSAGEDDDELVSVRLGDLKRLRAALAKAGPQS